MLNLTVSKQTRSEDSKNNIVIKSIKHINKLSKSQQIINHISFWILQKGTLPKGHIILNWKKNIT